MSDNENEYLGDDQEASEDLVLYELVEEHIARISLNRPERRNALLIPDMQKLLNRHLQAARDDDSIKVVILSGIGKDFCAGDDVRRLPVEAVGLKKGSRLPQTARIANAIRIKDNLDALLYSSKTIICACQGAVIGSGLNLAMASDILVASESAYFARPQARIGFAGFSTALPLMLLKMGINRGYEMLITGRRVSAREMKDWGVVSSLVSDEGLEAEAIRYARAVAMHSTDGLMIGKVGLHMFWDLLGVSAYNNFVKAAHPLFTNIVWREGESNFFREREQHGYRAALEALYKKWENLGFE